MGFFQKTRDLYKTQRDMKKVKKELKKLHIQAEAQGVRVVVSAEFEVLSIEISPDVSHAAIAPRLIDALNRALKKAQVVAGEKMRGVMGELGLPTGQ
jgi:DNA-binding protein YbaB